MPFKLFHRRDKSHDQSPENEATRLRKRQSSQPTAMPRESRETVPYESTSPSRAPVMGQSPILSDNRSSFQTSRSRPQTMEPPVYQQPAVDRTPELHPGFQNLSINDPYEHPSQKSPTTAHTRAVPHQPVVANDQYAENVADWNMVQNSRPTSTDQAPAPLRVSRDGGDRVYMPAAKLQGRDSVPDQASGRKQMVEGVARPKRGSVSRKPLDEDAQVAGLRRPSQPPPLPPHYARVGPVHPSSRAPDVPQDHSSIGLAQTSDRASVAPQDSSTGQAQPRPSTAHRSDPGRRDFLVHNADTAPSLEGVVDLTNTADTTIEEKWAPAVVHETVHTHHHHIREERITREIHNHEVYHRILPIIDVQVLPTRHYVLDPAHPGQQIEVSEDQIPGRADGNAHWVIAETVSKLRAGETPHGVTDFTARRFGKHEGEAKEWADRDGVERSERTWIHAPELEDGARLTGQSVPYHFNSTDGGEDGIRADLS